RLEALDSQIAALENSIGALKLERMTLQIQLDAIVYPVLTLPNEVISEIFQNRVDSNDALFSSPTSPLFLGHICREWRAIAISTPFTVEVGGH
ncbi:hypothetical protein C8R43DRAFT_853681, partial [Mycena crocata]